MELSSYAKSLNIFYKKRREKGANLLSTLSTWGARHHILEQLYPPGPKFF